MPTLINASLLLLHTFIKLRPSFPMLSCELGIAYLYNTLVNGHISVEQIEILMCFTLISERREKRNLSRPCVGFPT